MHKLQTLTAALNATESLTSEVEQARVFSKKKPRSASKAPTIVPAPSMRRLRWAFWGGRQLAL